MQYENHDHGTVVGERVIPAMPYYFCTYFDYHYLLRGLALYYSLKRHCTTFRLWILCLDHESYHVLSRMGLPEVHLIPLGDFERDDHDLLLAKQNRTLIEYYFTCTPSLPLFILKRHAEVDFITYLDADIYFYTDPAPIFREIAGRSIAIIEHRFPKNLQHLERNGIYNVGWVSFKRDENGLACLAWWRERCIEWCYDRPEGGRFADQKYLDDWPVRFNQVAVIQHKGANVAPWNIANYQLQAGGEHILVDDYPLVFFHFHGLRQIGRNVYDPNLESYQVRPSRLLISSVYEPYIRELKRISRLCLSLLGTRPPAESHRYRGQNTNRTGDVGVLRAVRNVKRLWYTVSGVLRGRYLLTVGEHIVWLGT